MDKVVIREKEIKGTKITLWKNINKYEENNSYNISISKRDMIYVSIMCQNRRSLPDAISKYESIIEWIDFMMNGEYLDGC